eukprot:XP_011667597.1 PREDICTED: cholecystokinin receptor type A-like [Strongylocentrotus purpuratus]
MFSGMEIIRIVLGCLAAALGIPGNITIIYVFVRQGIKNATDVTFTALAIVELIACIINSMRIPIIFFHNEHPWACFVEIIGGRSALYAGLFLTISIAVYRYQAICKPFDRRIGRRAAILISIGCTLLAVCLHVPFFFITTSVKFNEESYGCKVYGDNPWGGEVYATSQAIVFCVSAIAITVLYLIIYKFIRAHQIIRKKMINAHVTSTTTESVISVSAAVSKSDAELSNATESNGTCKQGRHGSLQNEGPCDTRSHPRPVHEKTEQSSKKSKSHQTDHKTTQVVIIITVIFFLFWLPSIVLDQVPRNQLSRIIPDRQLRDDFVYFCYQIKYINNIINVFIYLFVNQRFRHTCCRPFTYCNN